MDTQHLLPQVLPLHLRQNCEHQSLLVDNNKAENHSLCHILLMWGYIFFDLVIDNIHI